MKNTFVKDGIRIYNTDSMPLLDYMAKAGMVVDCIVTDPPYYTTPKGCIGNSGEMFKKDINKKGKVFTHNDCRVDVWAPKLFSILKNGGHAYIMTNHVNLKEYLNTIEDAGFHFIKSIIWNKGNKIMGRFYMSQFEYILFFRKGSGVKINNCGTPDILNVPNKKLKDDNKKNLHDTEKPVKLMEILINNSTKENEIVVDPFVGIGATAIAANNLGRRFIGGELDKKYFNITCNRISK